MPARATRAMRLPRRSCSSFSFLPTYTHQTHFCSRATTDRSIRNRRFNKELRLCPTKETSGRPGWDSATLGPTPATDEQGARGRARRAGRFQRSGMRTCGRRGAKELVVHADVESDRLGQVNAGAFSGMQAGRGGERRSFSGLSMDTASM